MVRFLAGPGLQRLLIAVPSPRKRSDTTLFQSTRDCAVQPLILLVRTRFDPCYRHGESQPF